MSQPHSSDRRRSERKRKKVGILAGPRGSKADKCENGVIEDYSGSGMKIRTGAPLRMDDSVVLYDLQGWPRYNLKVVWARKQGLIDKRSTGRPGQAFVAGCRISEGNLAKKKKQQDQKKAERQAFFAFNSIKVMAVGGGLLVAGAVGYFLFSLLSLW